MAGQGFTERPELKDLDDSVTSRPASTVFAVLFVLLSIVLLSLFIGTWSWMYCSTVQYPAASSRVTESRVLIVVVV